MTFDYKNNSTDLSSNPIKSLNADAIVASGQSASNSNPLNINSYYRGSSSPFSSGYYIAGSNGTVGFDFLVDDGAYQGELAIFSLEGMGQYELGSTAFIKEAAKRALSNSAQGYVVISDILEGARWSGTLDSDTGYNSGEYKGNKSFTMRAGDQFALMMAPNGTIQQVFDNADTEGYVRPLFSIAENKPFKASNVSLLRSMDKGANVFAIEDLQQDGSSDNDFNDFVFYMSGAEGAAPSFESVVNPVNDWRVSNVWKQIMEWKPITTPPSNPPIIEPPPSNPPIIEPPPSDPPIIEPPPSDPPIIELPPSDPPIIEPPPSDPPIIEPPPSDPPIIEPPPSEPPKIEPSEKNISDSVMFTLLDIDLSGKEQVNNPSLNLGDDIKLLEKYPIGIGNLSSEFNWKLEAFLSNGNFDVELPYIFDISYTDVASSNSMAAIKFKASLDSSKKGKLNTELGLSLLGLAKLKLQLEDTLIPLEYEFGKEFDAIGELSKLANSPISFDLGLGAIDNSIDENNELLAKDDAFQSFDVIKALALAANVGVALTGGGAALIPFIETVSRGLEAVGVEINAGVNINQQSIFNLNGFKVDFDNQENGNEFVILPNEEKEILVPIPTNFTSGSIYKFVPRVKPISSFVSQLNFTGKGEAAFEPKWIPGFDNKFSSEFKFPDPPFQVSFSDKFDPFDKFGLNIPLSEISLNIV